MASMSPVMTKVSGFPSRVPKSTVVSRVLGKQLEKSQASSGSAISPDTRRMVSSTAGDENRRSPMGGRWEVRSWDRWDRPGPWRRAGAGGEVSAGFEGPPPARSDAADGAGVPGGPGVPPNPPAVVGRRDAPRAAAVPLFRKSRRLGRGVSVMGSARMREEQAGP
jgi:hypothetical protein